MLHNFDISSNRPHTSRTSGPPVGTWSTWMIHILAKSLSVDRLQNDNWVNSATWPSNSTIAWLVIKHFENRLRWTTGMLILQASCGNISITPIVPTTGLWPTNQSTGMKRIIDFMRSSRIICFTFAYYAQNLLVFLWATVRCKLLRTAK
jgi:hypothetical protein